MLTKEHLENLSRLHWQISLTLELLLDFRPLIRQISLHLITILQGVTHRLNLVLKISNLLRQLRDLQIRLPIDVEVELHLFKTGRFDAVLERL